MYMVPLWILCMALFKNLFSIVLSNIILFQVKGIRSILVSDLISGSVSNVNHNYYSYGEHCWVFLQICINFNTKWRASNPSEAHINLKIIKILLLNIFFLLECGW